MMARVSDDERIAAADARIQRILWSAALAVLAIASIILLWSLAKTAFLFSSTQEGSKEQRLLTELLYYKTVWFSFILFASVIAWVRRLPVLLLGMACILGVEFMSLSLHAYVTGQPFKPIPPSILHSFVPHPLLQGIPRPGRYGLTVQTDKNLRRTVNLNKVPNPKLVAVYGGSTTYDDGAEEDADTWASALSRLLGSEYVVENHGAPGYSTVEHIIQTLFDFRNDRPKCAVYYLGWNDLRNNNIADLKPDYSNFHLLQQKQNLGLTADSSLLARRSAFFSILQNVGNNSPIVKGAISHEYDPHLSAIFKENVALIALIAKHFGVKPIFIPQILNYERLTASNPYGWLPFVEDRDVKRLMGLMNSDLAVAAKEADEPFLGEVLDVTWTDEDFIDNGHFNPQGSRKFARAIADRIASECR